MARKKETLSTTPSEQQLFSHTSKTLSGTGFNNNNISHKNTAVNSHDMQNIANNTSKKTPSEKFSRTIEPQWDTERTGDIPQTIKGLSDIIAKMRHDFKIPITTGNIRKRNALGVYGVTRQTEIKLNIAAVIIRNLGKQGGVTHENRAKSEIWHETGMRWAIEHGIMDGTRPGDALTRAEVVAMMRSVVM